jgi:formate dehydrogenase subunit gamma
MGQSSAILLRGMLAMTLAALCCAASAQQAASAPASAAMKGPPAGFVAPPEPQPNETNAQRAKTQPGNNAPFWRQVRQSGENEGFSTLPGAEKGVLIQRFVQYPGSRPTNAGEAWRQVRDRWIIPYGGAFLFIVLLALALFYWRKGPIGSHELGTADGGRQIERFTPFERAAHWANAIAFVLLAVSGLVMAFGKALLLPLVGHTLFGWLAYALKNIHNFAGPLFAVSLLVVIVTFVRDEMFERADWAWLRRFGGLFGGAEVPSPRFNAGEKVLFWIGALALGVVVVSSGLVLDKLLPGLDYLRGDMQLAHMVHSIAAIVMMAAFLGHIYMGTIGMRGAYKAMRHGQVDEAWAKEHHALWYEDIRAGKIPAQRSQPEPPPMTRGA